MYLHKKKKNETLKIDISNYQDLIGWVCVVQTCTESNIVCLLYEF